MAPLQCPTDGAAIPYIAKACEPCMVSSSPFLLGTGHRELKKWLLPQSQSRNDDPRHRGDDHVAPQIGGEGGSYWVRSAKEVLW